MADLSEMGTAEGNIKTLGTLAGTANINALSAIDLANQKSWILFFQKPLRTDINNNVYLGFDTNYFSRSSRAGAGLRLTQRSFYIKRSLCQPCPEIESESPCEHGPLPPRSLCPAFPGWDSAGALVYRAPSGCCRRRSVTGHLGDNLSAIRARRRAPPLRV